MTMCAVANAANSRTRRDSDRILGGEIEELVKNRACCCDGRRSPRQGDLAVSPSGGQYNMLPNPLLLEQVPPLAVCFSTGRVSNGSWSWPEGDGEESRLCIRHTSRFRQLRGRKVKSVGQAASWEKGKKGSFVLAGLRGCLGRRRVVQPHGSRRPHSFK